MIIMSSHAFELEGEEFCIPDSRISLRIEPKGCRLPVLDLPQELPSYLSLCFDEFSRDYTISSLVTSSSIQNNLVVYQPDDTTGLVFPEQQSSDDNSGEQLTPAKLKEIGTRILNHYDPTYKFVPTTIRPIQDAKTLAATRTDSSQLLIKITKITDAFEPLFGALTLYSITNDQCTRLSETFHFDMTPQRVRLKLREAYCAEDAGKKDDDAALSVEVDPATNLKMCVFDLPKDISRSEIHVVVQVSKVLSGDPEKALMPYLRPGNDTKLDENLRRLFMYRQVIGVGAVKVFEEGLVELEDLKCPFYAVKAPLSDAVIASVSAYKHVLAY